MISAAWALPSVAGDLRRQGDDDHRVVGLGPVVEVDEVRVLLEHGVLERLDLGRGLGEGGGAPPAGEGATGRLATAVLGGVAAVAVAAVVVVTARGSHEDQREQDGEQLEEHALLSH